MNHIKIGNALFKSGEYKNALVHYETAITLNPSLKNILKYNIQKCTEEQQYNIKNTFDKPKSDETSTSLVYESHWKSINKSPYHEEIDTNIIGSIKSDVDVFAFYLTQYHATPENDKFWGKGFTEWRQLPRAIPRFEGHYQPRIPADNGFYNLTYKESLDSHAKIAKMMGIKGFAFYYYWLNDGKVLHRPLDLLVQNKNISIDFFLIWANENWTRTWDGSEKEILLEQTYPEDQSDFLNDLARHFIDNRYYKINNRPLFVIYNPSRIPNIKSRIKKWREHWIEIYNINPLIYCAQTFGHTDPSEYDLDGALEFPPHVKTGVIPSKYEAKVIYDDKFKGNIFDYQKFSNISAVHPHKGGVPVKIKVKVHTQNFGNHIKGWIENQDNTYYEEGVEALHVRGWVYSEKESNISLEISGPNKQLIAYVDQPREDVVRHLKLENHTNKLGFKFEWPVVGKIEIQLKIGQARIHFASIEVYEVIDRFNLIRTVFPSWDNSARRPTTSNIFHGSTPVIYQRWLEEVLSLAKSNKNNGKSICCINAWNEWAEGAYLEPDIHYGAAYINATARAIKNSTLPTDILFVSHDAHNGGAQNSLIGIIKYIKLKTRLKFKILTLGIGPLLDKFVELGETHVLDTNEQDKFHQKILEVCNGEPRVLYCNTIASQKALLFLEKLKSHKILHIRELELSLQKYGGSNRSTAFKLADSVIACSNAVKDNLLGNEAVPLSKISVIHTSIDESSFREPTDVEKLNFRRELGLTNDCILVCAAGIGVPYRKGLDLYMSTLLKLYELNKGNWKFLWFGDIYPDDSDFSVEDLKNFNSLNNNPIVSEKLIMMGFKSNLRQYLSLCDIYVLSSREEPFARTVLEAGLSSLPILGFHGSGGISEVVDLNIGYLANKDDTASLAKSIDTYIQNLDIRSAHGANAKKKILENYTENINFPKIESAIKSICHPSIAIEAYSDIQEKSISSELAIIVISRNVRNLNNLVESIDKQGLTISTSIVCSWNGDTLSGINQPISSTLRVVAIPKYHFSSNCNKIFKLVDSKYVLFVNDDVILDDNALNLAIEAINEPSVGIVGINLRYKSGKSQHAGVFFNDENRSFHRKKLTHMWNDPELTSNCFVPAVTGAFMLLRSEEFAQLLFNEDFDVCGEDIILNLDYKCKFKREIYYLGQASALHLENETRKEFNQTVTPDHDLLRIVNFAKSARSSGRLSPRKPNVNIYTEQPGWIMHRMALEIQKYIGSDSIRINVDLFESPDISYYINYGYFRAQPSTGITIANFTHYDPEKYSKEFISAANSVDYCVSISKATEEVLLSHNIPSEKIKTILIGADTRFSPRMVIGISGRVYPGGRKGEDIVNYLNNSKLLEGKVRFVATNDSWGVPVVNCDLPDFYRMIDFLLVPSRLEGGPVPFMEALACGTISIAPEIGVIPQFSHITYPVGDTIYLEKIISDLADNHLTNLAPISSEMSGLDWHNWSLEHQKLFLQLTL